MNRLLTFGLKHPIPVLGSGLVYAVLGILYHEDVQDLVRLIQRDPMWTWGAGGISLVGLGYFGWSIKRRIGVLGGGPRGGGKDGGENGVMEFGGKIWAGLIVFAVAGYVLLMSYPTEVVHYLQFGILGVLLSVALRRVERAFVLTVVFGMLDEAYQYWWLHRHWGVYFDFNDVLLNIIAAALGLATVATLWPEILVENKITAETQGRREKRLRCNAAHVFALTFVALFTVGVWTGLIAIQAADVRDHTLLLLNRMKPFETFWETFNGATAQHHVVRAWWGVLLTALLTIGGIKTVELLRWRIGGR